MIKIKAWKILATLLLCAIGLESNAQQNKQLLVMNLEQCLSYAKEHSITLQQAQLSIDDYTISEASAKAEFLPNVSASIGQSLNNNPLSSNDPNTSYGGSYGVDLSMSLYKGGQNIKNVQKSKLSTQIAELSMAEDEDALELSITQVYIEILYAIEQIDVVKSSLTLSQKTLERGKSLFEAGSINEADLAQLETAVATAQYNVVIAESTLSNKYVQLKQLLDISNEMDVEVDKADMSSLSIARSIPSVSEVYSSALETRPEIAASTLNIETAELDEKIAKAGYLPSVNLSAGVGLSHSSSSDYTFSQQIKNNYNNSIGVSVSIPIFSKYQNKHSVAKSQNAIKYAHLTLADNAKALYQTIETLYNNAVNANALYMVSASKMKALEKSLELVTEQYDLGMKNIIDLLTEQDDFRQSSQEYLENKYILILNKALLEYYKTGIIKI